MPRRPTGERPSVRRLARPAALGRVGTGPRSVTVARRLGVLAAAIAIAGPAARPAWAGAWTLPEGTGQVIVKTSYSGADWVFDAAGQVRKADRFRKTEIEAFLEHGWRDNLTLLAKPVFQRVRSGEDRQTGLSSLEAGARVRLGRLGAARIASAQASIILPGRDFDRTAPLLTSGHTDYEARVLYGDSGTVLGLEGYFDGQLAYRRRGGPPADELRLDLTVGVDLSERWSLTGASETIATQGEARAPYTHYRSQKLQAALRLDLGRGRWIEAGARHTFAGLAALRETGGFVSVWFAY